MGGGMFGGAAAGGAMGGGFGQPNVQMGAFGNAAGAMVPAGAMQQQQGVQQMQMQMQAPDRKLMNMELTLDQRQPTYAFQHVFHTDVDWFEGIEHGLKVQRMTAIKQNAVQSQLVQKKREENAREQRRMLPQEPNRIPDPHGNARFDTGLYKRQAAMAYAERIKNGEIRDTADFIIRKKDSRAAQQEYRDPVKEMQEREREIAELRRLNRPKSCIEELVKGFDGLKQRRQQQIDLQAKQKHTMESLNDEMGKLVARQRETTKNAKELRKEYGDTSLIMIQCLQAVEATKRTHAALSSEEDEFREELMRMQSYLSCYDAHLAGLDKSQCLHQHGASSSRLDEQSQRKVVEFLQRQKTALEIITTEIHSKQAHLNVMERVYAGHRHA